MIEVYRIIKGYNKMYRVSNYGNIYSLNTGRVMKPTKTPGGTLYVHLSNKDSRKSFQVGKLVLQYFRPSQVPQECVLNLDLNRDNNMSNNLKYGTRGDKIRETNQINNKERGVYSFRTMKKGLPREYYRAVLKINNKAVTIGYADTKAEARALYIKAYTKAYGVSPYTN